MDVHLMLYLTGNMQAEIDDRESKRLHEWIGECPRCGCLSSAVVSDGMMDDGEIIVERVCPACWYAWTTAVCVDAADSAWDDEDGYDRDPETFWAGMESDPCAYCGSKNTDRIDVISHEPDVWVVVCESCGETFEVVIE